jgi:hypothetical protein
MFQDPKNERNLYKNITLLLGFANLIIQFMEQFLPIAPYQ